MQFRRVCPSQLERGSTLLSLVVVLIAFNGFGMAQVAPTALDLPVHRTVARNVIEALGAPVARIEIEPTYNYAGAQRFILYNVADAEQHFFVDADDKSRIRRLYWVQFEGYLPNNPQSSYEYKSTQTAEIGGLPFVVDTWPRKYSEPSRPGSDGARMRELLEAKGYHLPEEAAVIRLVYLADAAKRSELMIIYAEDLAGSTFHADDLAKGGAHADRWPGMSAELLKRAVTGLKIVR